MAFCTNCGANVAGAFCQQCGKPAGSAVAAPPPPVASPLPPGAAPAPRKTSPVVWVLIVLFGLFAIGGLAVLGAGMFFVHKASQAGIDGDLMRSNPALAVTRLIAAVNPDLEVLDVNERKGIITVRERSSGKTITLNFDDVKKGKIVVEDDGRGNSARVEFGGASAKLPSWLPAYPGAKVQANIAASSNDGEGGNFSFTTSDGAPKVVEFYQNRLKEAGFQIKTTATTADSSMLAAEDEGGGRSVVVVVGSGSEGRTVNVTYKSK